MAAPQNIQPTPGAQGNGVASFDAAKHSAVPLVADAREGLRALTEDLAGHRVDGQHFD